VSLATPAPTEEKVRDLTFATVDASTAMPSDPVWKRKDLWATVVLLAIVAGVWLYFTG
jgi:hypothetical protein